jgi:hypothetical protein
MSLQDYYDDIFDELTKWATLVDLQVQDLDNIIKKDAIRLMSIDCPAILEKTLDTSTDKSLFDLPVFSVDWQYYPKGIKTIFSKNDGKTTLYEQQQPTQNAYGTDVSDDIDKSYMFKFNYENQVKIVPAVDDSQDVLIINFIYMWKSLEQFPDAFYDIFITASKLAIITALMNSTLYRGNLSQEFVDNNSRAKDAILNIQQILFDQEKLKFISLCDEIDRNFNNYDGGTWDV